jgi:Ca-activated chloride channel family protein
VIAIFDWPWMLLAALLLTAGATLLIVGDARRRSKRLGRLAERHLVFRLVPVQLRPAGRAVRVGAATMLAGIALAGPRWGEEVSAVRGQGVDVVLALDASLSMLATDERPNRLERLRQDVRRYRALAPGDRIAMLAFAGRSYILTPLTVDDGAIELFIENLDPSIVGQAGSSLARTITQATDLLRSSRSASDRALILMSDGEAFEPQEEILQAARAAAAEGIAIVTVGYGTEAGGTIPVDGGERGELKRDEAGAIVVSKYSPQTLRAIALESKGTFIEAAASDKAARIRAALQRLRASARTIASGVARTPRFQWFLLPALMLLMWETVAASGRHRAPARALLAAGLVSLTQGCTLPGSVARQAAREYNAGRFPPAAAMYRSAISQGDTRPAVLYNLGTALVAGDSLRDALEPLERITKATDSELRFRALFNAGLVHLKRGLQAEAAGDSAREAFSKAVETYQQALLLRSTDRDAKWNYELALRKEEQHGGGGGGGGGSDSANENPQNEFDAPENTRPSGGLGQQRAEQLLDAAAREERGVQGRKQKLSRPQPPPGGKDW